MRLFAESALLAGGWARNVVLELDDEGYIADIAREAPGKPDDAQATAGPVLPGLPNLHSHAFQRALAGRAERRGPEGEDSFWSWRQAMYAFVARVEPEQLGAIAEQLYVEMLKAGYTSVGEFHYLHHDPAGARYEPLTEMSDRVIAAAASAGIAITHLPVLYAAGGFGGAPPGPGQRHFVNSAEGFAELLEALFTRRAGHADVRLGVAPHSLRAVPPELLREGAALISNLDPDAPIHIHAAEQVKEVEDCLAWSGQRPVAWLLDHVDLDARWCLVHATHLERSELERLAGSGAVVGLCPTTEANLGDGLFPAVEHLELGGRFGIGSDSHVSVSPAEELRTLEYGQRLKHRRRAVLADAAHPSVGANLYVRAARGGAQALGLQAGTLAPGKRADLVVLDPEVPTLADKREDELLDALVFAGNLNPVRDVMVGGRWRVVNRGHPREEESLRRYRRALQGLRP